MSPDARTGRFSGFLRSPLFLSITQFSETPILNFLYIINSAQHPLQLPPPVLKGKTLFLKEP